MEKFDFEKIFPENFENFEIFSEISSFSEDFLIESIRKSLIKSKFLRFCKIFEIFEKHIFEKKKTSRKNTKKRSNPYIDPTFSKNFKNAILRRISL